ncbi:MAG: hypothetical protein H7Z19_21855, partial [Chitinophagaceae bacterium]|nr:hypothetical protein [Rubrivivax sp.]
MTNINAEAEITQLTALVRLRRAEAKDCRDDDDLEGAVAALADAVSALRRSPLYAEVMDTATTTPSPQARQLAAQLADCLGMRGGNLRRLDRLDQALKCFDEGRALEESTRLALDSSYNLVNAVTLPIETGSATVPAQRAALERAVQSIDRQLRGA